MHRFAVYMSTEQYFFGKPRMHYFQKTREDDKKEDRNESDKEEDWALNEVEKNLASSTAWFNIARDKDMFPVWQLNSGVHFNWRGSVLEVWFENPVSKGSSNMSANQEDHSDRPAHRSTSCILILTWLEHYYSTQWCRTTANHFLTSVTEHTVTVWLCQCLSKTTRLSINYPKVHIFVLISSQWKPVLTNNSWVESMWTSLAKIMRVE